MWIYETMYWCLPLHLPSKGCIGVEVTEPCGWLTMVELVFFKTFSPLSKARDTERAYLSRILYSTDGLVFNKSICVRYCCTASFIWISFLDPVDYECRFCMLAYSSLDDIVINDFVACLTIMGWIPLTHWGLVIHFCLQGLNYQSVLGLYSLSGKTSYRKISWSLEAARFGFKLFQSLWNLAGTSAALLPRCLSNVRAIRPLQRPISRLRDFTRFGGKTSYRLVNRGPAASGRLAPIHYPI